MKEKLLILDDELLILTSLENFFEDDYEVYTTADAPTARQLAREHDMAVIVCDERMPLVAGHLFLRQVREVSRATTIMMSGYADMNALTEAINGGQIFAYIEKPWEPLKLRAQVDAAAVHFKLIQEVEQERALLRALMEGIPDPIYFKDCESRFTRVNQAHARALGARDPAECIGKTDSDYFEPADALRSRAEEEEIVRSGRPQLDRIEEFKSPGGGHGWMSTTRVPMFDRDGRVSGIAGISRNITAVKNSEEMLREQNEHNRMILETSHDAFIGMKPDGTITVWNRQAEQTFGWAASEVIGRTLCETVVAPAYRHLHRQGVENFVSSSHGSRLNQAIEIVAVHRDGHEFPVEATVWPVRARGVYSFNAFVRDISERRHAEDARRKETTLVQLLQSVTMAANQSSTIEHTAQTCLDRICSYNGWSVGHVYLREDSSPELNSAGLWRLEEDERFAAFREASERLPVSPGMGLPGAVVATGKPQWIVNLADEEPLSERTRAAVQAGLQSGFGFPVVVEEKIVGVLEFFSLPTVQPDEDFLNMMGHVGAQLGQVIIRQRAEEDLRRAKAAAESANRAKSEFLTTMSHEMRTPMNAILGMADLLAESSLVDEQRHYVSIFQKAGASLLDLINDILDLSKVESGHVELETIGFDLRALLEKTVEMMVSRANDRGLQLTLEILPEVPSGVIGDPNRLRQILLNMIGNALKFTEQGSVTLRVEPDPGGAGCIRFNVVDTGIGIAADKADVIFDRFTQADSSTTRKYGGTGLGLAISRGLAELMGGRIGCTSEVGKGSTFFLVTPFASSPQSEIPEVSEPTAIAPSAVEPRREQTGCRILLAEDSEYNVVLIKAYLKDGGFEVDFAENGKVAVEKVKSKKPDLILMDLQMPVMGGLEATRAIRKWESATHAHPIPILALTAHAMGEGGGNSLEAGCTEHLTKPIKKAILLEAISRNIGVIRVTPPEGIEALVPDYLASVRRQMGEILADYKTAGRLGHQFKGSGDSYGFPEITRTGAALELAAIDANEDEIRRQTIALANYLDRVEVLTP